MFTQNNVRGFTQDELNEMNQELNEALSKYSKEELMDGEREKYEASLIFNKRIIADRLNHA